MLKLYRGIVDILTQRGETLIEAMGNHIRSFNNGEDKSNNFGVTGFWNILLEITFILYVQTFQIIGIVLTLTLAIVFFPLHAFVMAIINILDQRSEHFITQAEPTLEKKDGTN